jgi:hypothetical protein
MLTRGQDEVEHQKKATYISDSVLSLMDKDKDGKVSPEEFEAAGFDGLPTFEGLGAEGHHYDVESGSYVTIVADNNELTCCSCRIFPSS